jgi:hypothetical protein
MERPSGGLEEAEAHVPRVELDAVEVARDVPLGREEVDGGGVGVLLLPRVVAVLEADGVGDLADVRLVAGEKVPPLRVARARAYDPRPAPASSSPSPGCPSGRC